MKKLSSLLLAFVVVTLAGCAKTIPVRNYMDMPIAQYGSEKSTSESVEKAIVRGAVSLGWKTEIQKKGEILATLNIRSHQLVVLITHDDKHFSIQYKDSVNLKYNGTKIHRQYANWLNNLINTINAQNISG